MDSKKLENFFRGNCSEQEIQEVLDWFKSEKLNPEQEQDLNKFWLEAENEKVTKEATHNASRIFSTISKIIDRQEKETEIPISGRETEKSLSINSSQWNWRLKAVAAVLLPICFLYLFSTNFLAGDRPVSKMVSLEALPGTKKTISLEDGSKVVLNSGSKIHYQEHFSAQKREIILEGEAFFEVTEDSQRPFIVKTGNLSTQALGTSFSIRHHPDENDFSVALASGSVKVDKEEEQGRNQIAKLAPGQQLIYASEDQSFKVITYDPNDVFAWREGILYFKKANLRQVVRKLEKWYGVEIEIKGKVPGKEREWLYTGTYNNQSLDKVLEGISFVKYFSCEKKGNKVILNFN